MTNPSLGLLLPFLLGWAAYRGRRAAKLAVWKPALATALAILSCVPWTVRNYLVFSKFVPLRSNFPLELYIGNNNNYATRQFVWPPKITKERELLRYFRMGESAFMEEEQRKAMEFIRSHPGIAVKLIGEKFVVFWMGVAEPVQVFKTTDSLLIRVLIVCSTLAAVGALLGIVALIGKRSPYAFPAAVYPLVFPWLYYVTHANLRYRHPIDPVILLLAAAAVAAACSLVTRGRKQHVPSAVELAVSAN
jgi:hypothetical protein